MTIQIRHGVFETNSSSTHSVSIGKGVADKSYYSDLFQMVEDDTLVPVGGCFGWEVEEYHDAYTKLNYAATFAGESKECEKMLRKVVKEMLGVKLNLKSLKDRMKNYNAYIDHQSYDVAGSVFESEEVLKKFIFGKDSILRTDNDNH